MNQNNEDRKICANQTKPPCPRKSLNTITNIGQLSNRILSGKLSRQYKNEIQNQCELQENLGGSKQRCKLNLLKLESPNSTQICAKQAKNLTPSDSKRYRRRKEYSLSPKKFLRKNSVTVGEATPTQFISQTPKTLENTSFPNTQEDPYLGTQEHQYASMFPMQPQQALKLFKEKLSPHEQTEILVAKQVYFLGLDAQKNQVNLTDRRGHLRIFLKDHILYRYQIVAILGQGTFGQVLKCYDFKHRRYVAIKILRNRSTMQGQEEIDILRTLNQKDSEDNKNILHMYNSFVYRGHLCISFELLSINLYEFMKRKNFETVNNQVLKRISVQLLNAIKFTHSNNIIHCDLKPENILLKQPNKTGIKLVDFGASCFSFNRIYTYIQSRYYRAPEIILGCAYGFPIDMWSFGCILAEMHMGRPLFAGENEHDQIIRIMGSLGEPPAIVLKRGRKVGKYFTALKRPRIVANKNNVKLFPGTRPLEEILNSNDEHFIDLIKRCLEWLPENRITPEDALSHPWIAGGNTQSPMVQRRFARRNAKSVPPCRRREVIDN